MAHHTLKSGYSNLAERLNRFPQGAPPSNLLFKILSMLFSKKEAELVSLMPIKPFTAKKASRIWKMKLADAQKVLDKLAARAILIDFEQNGETWYVLPPPMAGFFEFSMMRIRNDIDQKVLSELFYEYLNVEEDFIKDLFTRGEHNWVEHLSMKMPCQMKMPCMFWIMNALLKSLKMLLTLALGCAIAAIKWIIWEKPAMHRRIFV